MFDRGGVKYNISVGTTLLRHRERGGTGKGEQKKNIRYMIISLWSSIYVVSFLDSIVEMILEVLTHENVL